MGKIEASERDPHVFAKEERGLSAVGKEFREVDRIDLSLRVRNHGFLAGEVFGTWVVAEFSEVFLDSEVGRAKGVRVFRRFRIFGNDGVEFRVLGIRRGF